MSVYVYVYLDVSTSQRCANLICIMNIWIFINYVSEWRFQQHFGWLYQCCYVFSHLGKISLCSLSFRIFIYMYISLLWLAFAWSVRFQLLSIDTETVRWCSGILFVDVLMWERLICWIFDAFIYLIIGFECCSAIDTDWTLCSWHCCRVYTRLYQIFSIWLRMNSTFLNIYIGIVINYRQIFGRW